MSKMLHAEREDPARPAWREDRLDSSSPPEIEAPYFDQILGAWVISRHEDLLAAFRSPGLSPAGPNRGGSEPPNGQALSKLREETLRALNPDQISEWRERLTGEADIRAATLPVNQAVDIVAEYTKPLCLSLAAMVTGLDLQEAILLQEKARQVSAAAAEPFDRFLQWRAKSANAELRCCFHKGPEVLRDSAFVALSQTLSCLLANAWFALLSYPPEWQLLHRQPDLIDQAVEELLRYAGLPRVLFRVAVEDVSINALSVRKGERIVLRILAANRDPERFHDSNQVGITHRRAGHFTLGAGPHSCVAANLIRMATAAIMCPLTKRFPSADLIGPVEWMGGSIFRSPSRLCVEFGEAKMNRE